MDLVNTIYVPIFTINLISVSRLDYYGYELKLVNNGSFLFYNSCLIGFETLCGNLYSLNLYCKYLLSLLSCYVYDFSKKQNQVNENSSILQHKRLSHISKERFECLVKNEILTSLGFSNFNSYVECIKRKYVEVKKKNALRAIALLECIHIDIWKPYQILTTSEHQYFISFINDFSRYFYAYLIHEKSEALDVFKIYKAKVENQLNQRIKSVKSNRDGENYGRFTKSSQHPNAFTLFLREYGIITNYTILETLDQNGVTEQQNRTLIDIVISIMSNSTLL